MYRDDIDERYGIDGDLGTLVATLQDGTREWMGNLESPSPEAVIWQPYSNGPSIGGNLLHIAGCEWYWLGKFVNGESEPEEDPAIKYDKILDQGSHIWPTPPAQPIEWYFKVLADRRAKTIEMIRAHGRPQAVYSGRGSESTYGWIVAHLVEHDSYHGGQAVLLHEMFKRLRASDEAS